MKIRIFITLLIISIGSISFSDVCFTEKEIQGIYDRLDKDEKIIKWQSNRWNQLIDTTPKIKYEVVDDVVIIQTIEFPVKGDKPLIYEVKMKIFKKVEPHTYFPFTLSLCGIIESNANNYVDAKIGVQIFNFSPIRNEYMQNTGLHILIGAQSSGISLSWKMPKYFENTRIHFYSGISYQLKKSFGIGIGLNF